MSRHLGQVTRRSFLKCALDCLGLSQRHTFNLQHLTISSTTLYHLIDKAPEWSSASTTNFAFAIRGRMLGIGMCTCGLTDFPRISLIAYSALVVAVLIVHVATDPACTAPARVGAHVLLRYNGQKFGIRL